MEARKFYRSRTDKVFAGVCGGLAEYFNIDTILVRLLFIVFVIAAGGGVLAYIILWIITPEKPIDFTQFQNPPTVDPTVENKQSSYEEPKKPQEPVPDDPFRYHRHRHRERGNLIGGLVLITLGALFLADEFIPHVRFGDLWPLILVAIGIGLLINNFTGKKNN
jgi:phage shock protein PspC (stress-responsive transcriptional regulator)